jgi:hypothetical protein
VNATSSPRRGRPLAVQAGRVGGAGDAVRRAARLRVGGRPREGLPAGVEAERRVLGRVRAVVADHDGEALRIRDVVDHPQLDRDVRAALGHRRQGRQRRRRHHRHHAGRHPCPRPVLDHLTTSNISSNHVMA